MNKKSDLQKIMDEFTSNLEAMGVRDFLVIAADPDRPMEWFSDYNNSSWATGAVHRFGIELDRTFNQYLDHVDEENDD